MKYRKQYLKTKEKYLSFKGILQGGFNEITDESNSFLRDWREIPNVGQFNCGIFFTQLVQLMKLRNWRKN